MALNLARTAEVASAEEAFVAEEEAAAGSPAEIPVEVGIAVLAVVLAESLEEDHVVAREIDAYSVEVRIVVEVVADID